ncbi:hypothetical protein [Nocardia rhamnosiphila]
MGAKTPRKKLTIEFDKPLPPELYANLASLIWLQVRAMSDAANFDFNVLHDGPVSMSAELNEHWERFAEQAQWDTE